MLKASVNATLFDYKPAAGEYLWTEASTFLQKKQFLLFLIKLRPLLIQNQHLNSFGVSFAPLCNTETLI